jgi:2',3'-cyclic-nucleotide 2'-phosphodiesterase (5'-nucleotidase family)
MKHCKLLVTLIAIFAVWSLAQAQVDTLTILHLSDTHSHLTSYGPKDSEGNPTLGGMARLATLIGMTRMTEPNVMLFHSGDLFVGDFMFQKYVGVAELEIMKALQYDALELGNHEFDLYPSTLEGVLDQADFPDEGFPILCANLDITGDPTIGYFVRPYIIREVGGLRIGIFGLLTELTNQISNPSPLTVLPPLSEAPRWVDTLRTGHDCDMVILLSHLGVFEDFPSRFKSVIP